MSRDIMLIIFCLECSSFWRKQANQVILTGGHSRHWTLLISNHESSDARVAEYEATRRQDGVIPSLFVAEKTVVFELIHLHL